jgi:hypothetical protein
MVIDWLTATGVVSVIGIAGVLVYVCKTAGCGK